MKADFTARYDNNDNNSNNNITNDSNDISNIGIINDTNKIIHNHNAGEWRFVHLF